MSPQQRRRPSFTDWARAYILLAVATVFATTVFRYDGWRPLTVALAAAGLAVVALLVTVLVRMVRPKPEPEREPEPGRRGAATAGATGTGTPGPVRTGGAAHDGLRGALSVVVFGAVFVVVGAWMHFEVRGYPNERFATGKVVRTYDVGRADGYVFEYAAPDGRLVTADRTVQNGPPVVAGDDIALAYRPDEPDDVRVMSYSSGMEYLALGAGTFVLLAGVQKTWHAARRRLARRRGTADVPGFSGR